MYTIKGKYNECIVYSDTYDAAMTGQLYAVMNQESVKGSSVRIMPDCHAGKGCVIGTTMTISDKVIPNLVGADIGCGMTAVRLKLSRGVEFEKLDSFIRRNVPSGRATAAKKLRSCGFLKELICRVNVEEAERTLGSLGGGNHFIELDRDSGGDFWLIVHSGSRKLGTVVNRHYQDLAYEALKEKRAGASLKELTRGKTAKEIAAIRTEFNRPLEVPYELAFLEGENRLAYMHDVLLTQDYASANRETIAEMIMSAMKWKEAERIETVHNYIGTLSDGTHVVRKGAVSAKKDEVLIIPMNMRDGVLLCRGKGNPDWNESAPHGAGRRLSRKDAKETLSMDEYREGMKGIYSSSVARSTLDESPMAYKPMEEILANIGDTVEVTDILKPVYNFKAGGEE